MRRVTKPRSPKAAHPLISTFAPIPRRRVFDCREFRAGKSGMSPGAELARRTEIHLLTFLHMSAEELRAWFSVNERRLWRSAVRRRNDQI